MNPHLTIRQKLAILLAFFYLSLGMSYDLTAEAAKKKDAGPDPAAKADEEVKKGLEPINEQLTKLMMKVHSRSLLSPDEASQLADLKYKLLDMMNQYPENVQLTKSVYQAGVLFMVREEYHDAYELFNFLAQGFATNPYGIKSKGQIQQLEKQLGTQYFSAQMIAPATTAEVPPAAAPATAPKK